MDEEDLAEAEEARKLQTADGFAGLGSTEDDNTRRGFLLDLLKIEGETMGVKLLKKMGWREGQGVGPKVRRRARLDETPGVLSDSNAETHLFAPENTPMISFVRKNDHKGLGFEGETRLSDNAGTLTKLNRNEDEDDDSFGTARSAQAKKPKKKPVRGGIGIGVLNDTGSDDEDPYEIGPRISYNRVIGGDKKKKKPKAAINGSINPVVRDAPVFISKKVAAAKASTGFRKCHDGRLPLDGFVLSSESNNLSMAATGKTYPPPEIPADWKSAKQGLVNPTPADYQSTADAAKASKLDPKSRASLLGEAALPGKSVFDFLSTSARDRLVAATGKDNLPAARGEIPKGYSLTAEEREKELANLIPKLEKETALAALARGSTGWMPYGDDENKRRRYVSYLEYQSGTRSAVPERAPGIPKDDWLKELHEFFNCARIFKPMTGAMATRFTSSSAAPKSTSDSGDKSTESLVSKPASKPEDPAEAAAKLGMFGPMTRSTADFYPTRLLCKRFNVKPPAHVQLDPDRAGEDAGNGGGFETGGGSKNLDLVSKSAMQDMLRDSGGRNQYLERRTADRDIEVRTEAAQDDVKPVVVDAERNEALEGQKAGEAVFKAIFGDSSDEEE